MVCKYERTTEGPAPAVVAGLDDEDRGSCGSAPRVWGFVDEDDVVDLLATDTADNWLHVGLGAAGVLVGSVAGALGLSARREHRRLERAVTEAAAAAATAERPRRALPAARARGPRGGA